MFLIFFSISPLVRDYIYPQRNNSPLFFSLFALSIFFLHVTRLLTYAWKVTSLARPYNIRWQNGLERAVLCVRAATSWIGYWRNSKACFFSFFFPAPTCCANMRKRLKRVKYIYIWHKNRQVAEWKKNSLKIAFYLQDSINRNTTSKKVIYNKKLFLFFRNI